jgi:hypothetical protein
MGQQRQRVTRTVTLAAGRHAIYRLAPDLLLVFKPRRHREADHAHPHLQRLRVLRGRLEVETGAASTVLDASSAALVLEAGQRHATEALEDTWLLAEVGAKPTSKSGGARGATRRRVLTRVSERRRPR